MRHVTRVPISNSETAYRELMLADDNDRIEGKMGSKLRTESVRRKPLAPSLTSRHSQISPKPCIRERTSLGPQTGVFTRDSAKAMRAWDKRNRKRP